MTRLWVAPSLLPGPLRLEESRMDGLPGARRLGPVGTEIFDDDLTEVLDAALGEQRPLGAELVAAAAPLGKTRVGGAEGCPQAHHLAQGGVFLAVRRERGGRVAGRHLVLDESDRLTGRLQHFELLLGPQGAGEEAFEHPHEGRMALGSVERVQIAQELAVLLHAAQIGIGLSAVRHR